MQLLDPTVPLDWNPPVSPGRTPPSFERITLIARDGRSNVSRPARPLRGAATVRGGTSSIEGMPLRFVGADGPARGVVRRAS
jgi:kynurenine formamidase